MKKEKNTINPYGIQEKFIQARRQALSENRQDDFEIIGEYKGVIFINDAASGTVMNVRASLETIASPVLLITGLAGENPDFTQLAACIREKVKAVIFMGDSQENILRSCTSRELLFVAAGSMEEAMSIAANFSRPGDAVLYSPGGIGQRQSAKSRELGRAFTDIFRKLTKK